MLPSEPTRALTPEEEALLAAGGSAGMGYNPTPPPGAYGEQALLVPAGTPAPPTTTVAYPVATAGPPGGAPSPETAVGTNYGTQVPAATPVATPAPVAEPAYQPQLPVQGNPNTPSGSAMYGGDAGIVPGSASNDTEIRTNYPSSGAVSDIRYLPRPTVSNTGNGSGPGNIAPSNNPNDAAQTAQGRQRYLSSQPVPGDTAIFDNAGLLAQRFDDWSQDFLKTPQGQLASDTIQGAAGPGGFSARIGVGSGLVDDALRSAVPKTGADGIMEVLGSLRGATAVKDAAGPEAEHYARMVEQLRADGLITPPRVQPTVRESVADPYPTRKPAPLNGSSSETLPLTPKPAEPPIVDTRVTDLLAREQNIKSRETAMRLSKREAALDAAEAEASGVTPEGRYEPTPLAEGVATRSSKNAAPRVILPPEGMATGNGLKTGFNRKAAPITSATERVGPALRPAAALAAGITGVAAAVGAGNKAQELADNAAAPSVGGAPGGAGQRDAGQLLADARSWWGSGDTVQGALDPNANKHNYVTLDPPTGSNVTTKLLGDTPITSTQPGGVTLPGGFILTGDGAMEKLNDFDAFVKSKGVGNGEPMTLEDVGRMTQGVVGGVQGLLPRGSDSARPGRPTDRGAGPDSMGGPGERGEPSTLLHTLGSDDLAKHLAQRPTATTPIDGILYLNDGTPVGFDSGSGWEIRGNDVSLSGFWQEAEAAGHTQTGKIQPGETVYGNDTPAAGGASPTQTVTQSAPIATPTARQNSVQPTTNTTSQRSSGVSTAPSRSRGSDMSSMFGDDDEDGLNEADFMGRDWDNDGKVTSKDRSIGKKRFAAAKRKRKTKKTSTVPARTESPTRTKVLGAINESMNTGKKR